MNADYENLFPLSIFTYSPAAPSLFLFICLPGRSTNHKQWREWQFKSNKEKNHKKKNWNQKMNVYNIVQGRG